MNRQVINRAKAPATTTPVTSRVLQRAAVNAAPVADVPPIVHDVLRSPGRPLDAETRAFMEPRFGHDFSHVRVHTDSTAGESARAVNALAYTVGRGVVFGPGQYAPATSDGQRLMAHELTHVVQQNGGASNQMPTLQRQPDKDESEKAKQKLAARFIDCGDRQAMIESGIKDAKSLAARAVIAFERDIPLSNERKAMDAHFGSLSGEQEASIKQRYKQIRDNLESKTYTCAKKGEKEKKGKELVDLCGKAPCTGSNITLFPIFGTGGCPAGPVILHEAAHNAGACGDISQGKGYPPKNAADNAYSYEYFASTLVTDNKEPELPKRTPKAPEVPD